jgi:hypothetical protein
VPHSKPLKLFDGNTAHSTGYFWQRGGGVYFGGKLWHQDSDWSKQYYSSGRWGDAGGCGVLWSAVCMYCTWGCGVLLYACTIIPPSAAAAAYQWHILLIHSASAAAPPHLASPHPSPPPRYELDTRDDSGKEAFHVLTNTKMWLAQWGITHWGKRVKIINYQAHDCTRVGGARCLQFLTVV